MKIKIAGIVENSIVDGPGVRYTIFAQGCPHHCKGCHNPQTWDYDSGGKFVDIEELFEDIMHNSFSKKVTFSGGEPFYQINEFLELAKMLKSHSFSIIVYTGYTFEELTNIKISQDPKIKEFLEIIDYLIDGRFDINKRSLELNFRGSANQRIIDIKKTLESNKVVLADFN